ncbi:AAA family ATPase [Planktothrix agardhii 1029]|uniref:McrB family protein n=1 Tax=Planktothrix agardhii TaxID=1160 RepID=UPI001D0A3083|nr:AAA family ATPase [Planktothrix agardhii]MCB8767007.1 AAA family ATPase [Planktothrix agardhii 1809]MCB8776689.1 AAA family ATPase [Planktothrix agardhii 1031]MCB8781115.1 AAA family ATPase [Planktothrix agardhii 1808]MCF3567698.1 AAA family ATPase [Planktothrix agardhii 1807]MCF3573191.1 AAA family ATPase [Planktothrix agardhii 1805]
MIGNSQEKFLFSASFFECMELLENEYDSIDSEYDIEFLDRVKYVTQDFLRIFISRIFISNLWSNILNLSYLYNFNTASCTCNLTVSTPEGSDLENFDINNHAHIRITLKPAGIDIRFIVNNQTDDKERLINNCIKLLCSEVLLDSEGKKNLIYFEHFQSFLVKANLSNANEKLKELVDWPVPFYELLEHIINKKTFENQDIDIFNEITKTSILEFTDDRLIAKASHILLSFFPLLILANLDNPMPAIKNYLYYRDFQFYSLKNCSKDIGIDETELQRWVNNINRKGQIILQGPPGTGKTFIAKKLAAHFTRGRDGFSEIIQFHPSYSYEDFIEGIRPRTENGQLTYDLVPGRFLEFCKKAEAYDDICVLIIDEINRANLSNVFGELMYLLEYRRQKICLAGSHEPFKIPENVRIIGTMNTADRSIALVDHALRRRFAFIKIAPNYTILKRYHKNHGNKKINFSIDQLIQVIQDINKIIDDPNYEIGISFFMVLNIEYNIQDIWEMEIEPYLEEYFYDGLNKIEEFRWDKVKIKLGLNANENN